MTDIKVISHALPADSSEAVQSPAAAAHDHIAPAHEHPVRLEQWHVCGMDYCPQGRGYRHLRGTVFNHPDTFGCPDGMVVCTSVLITLCPPVAVTKNRAYHLVGEGKP
jgi:hypothetical protein